MSTVAVPVNAWTRISVKLVGWPYRNDITSIAVAYAGTGTTVPWAPAFQIDDVGDVRG